MLPEMIIKVQYQSKQMQLTEAFTVEELYEEIRLSHKCVFWKTKIDQKTYYTTYAQLACSLKNVPIHLIIIEDDKDDTQLAYSIKSKGFPIIANVQPIFQFVYPLEHLKCERQGSYVMQIFVTNQAKPYKEFKFATKDMAEAWMTAIMKCKQQRGIKKENPNNLLGKQHLVVKPRKSTSKNPSKPKKQAPQYLRQTQEMQTKNKQSMQKLDQLKLNCNELEKQNEEYKRNHKIITKKNKALQQQINSLLAQKIPFEQQINYLSKLIEKYDSLYKVSKKKDVQIQISLDAELISFKQKSMRLDRQVKIKSEENSILNNKINTLEQQLQALKESQKEFQHIKKLMLKSIKKTEQISFKEIELKLKQMQYLQFFQGTIFVHHLDQKIFLINSLQEFKQHKIVKTTRLFTFDPLNKTSFHKYIDEVPDIVILIKTQKGYFLAGFSESPFSSTHPANKGGLILSLTNSKSYRLLKGKRSITYDNYLLIIGNSEIRWNTVETKCYSNFGIPNGYYDSKGDKINELLGEGTEREVLITAVEVHKVTFEE